MISARASQAVYDKILSFAEQTHGASPLDWALAGREFAIDTLNGKRKGGMREELAAIGLLYYKVYAEPLELRITEPRRDTKDKLVASISHEIVFDAHAAMQMLFGAACILSDVAST